MSLAWWIYGSSLGVTWFWRGAEAVIGMGKVADISEPQWDRHPSTRVTVVVPAKDEGENIEQCLQSLLALDYPNYEIVAVDDRSTPKTARAITELRRA